MEIAIYGAGGSAWEIFYMAQEVGLKPTCFVALEAGEFLGLPVVTHYEGNAVIAVGNSWLRKKIIENTPNVNWISLICPSVKIKSDIQFGIGCVVYSGCVLTADVVIGNFAQINLNSTISHNARIGNYFTTAPGVNIAGNVTIGNQVYFGINSCVKDKIKICNDVLIGAGACVVKNIDHPGTYIGVPAKCKKEANDPCVQT